MNRQEHWDRIYAGKSPDGLPWHQPHLQVSLDVVDSLRLNKSARILDVGGGLSTLVRDLLDRGFEDVAVLEVSPIAIRTAAGLLGERAALVRWIEGDVTRVDLPAGSTDLWHDRAVFHFLSAPAERAAYVAAAERAIRPGGHALLCGFAPTGPARCSGLEVVRSSPAQIETEFAGGFRLVDVIPETHVTPGGVAQDFLYFLLRREVRTSDRPEKDP